MVLKINIHANLKWNINFYFYNAANLITDTDTKEGKTFKVTSVLL